MISSCEKDMTCDEIDWIGRDFAWRYYDALAGKPDASAWLRFFDRTSTYTSVQHSGRPDHKVRGADSIGAFARRMQYDRCTATVRSVNTTRVGPTRFKVSAVGALLRPDNEVAREFLQTTVVKRAAWTRAELVVVDTVFEFRDRIVDDVLPRPGASDESVFDRSQADVGRMSGKKPTVVDGRRRKESSSPRRAGNSDRRCGRTMDVFNSNAVKKPTPAERIAAAVKCAQKDESKTVKDPMTNLQRPGDAKHLLKGLTVKSTAVPKIEGNGDIHFASRAAPNHQLILASRSDEKSRTPVDSRTTCVRKAKNAAKDPMADAVPSYVVGTLGVSRKNVKQKAGIAKLITETVVGSLCKKSSPSTIDNCKGLASCTAMVVSNEKPLAEAQPVAVVKTAAAPKVKPNGSQSAGEKTATSAIIIEKPTNRRPDKSKKRPFFDVENPRKFISTNRFGCLTLDYDFDSRSSSDEGPPMNSSENMPKASIGRRKRFRHRNQLRISSPTSDGPEETTATGESAENEMSVTSTVVSSSKHSGETKNIAVRDSLTVRSRNISCSSSG